MRYQIQPQVELRRIEVPQGNRYTCDNTERHGHQGQGIQFSGPAHNPAKVGVECELVHVVGSHTTLQKHSHRKEKSDDN